LRLPRNEYLIALAEVPVFGGDDRHQRGFPWRELSPSLAFLTAVVLLCIGVKLSLSESMIAGGVLALSSFFWAALLEFRANRRVAEAGGDPTAMGMLSQSSDYTPVMGRVRRR
jgi:hypothetical protein